MMIQIIQHTKRRAQWTGRKCESKTEEESDHILGKQGQDKPEEPKEPVHEEGQERGKWGESSGWSGRGRGGQPCRGQAPEEVLQPPRHRERVCELERDCPAENFATTEHNNRGICGFCSLEELGGRGKSGERRGGRSWGRCEQRASPQVRPSPCSTCPSNPSLASPVGTAASPQGPALPLLTHPDFFRLELTLRLPGSLVQAKNTEFTVSLAVAATRCWVNDDEPRDISLVLPTRHTATEFHGKLSQEVNPDVGFSYYLWEISNFKIAVSPRNGSAWNWPSI